jgi:hypothetical protein
LNLNLTIHTDMTFERKILKKTFGLVTEDNRRQIKTNAERYKLYMDVSLMFMDPCVVI